jgi:hypothetical protein
MYKMGARGILVANELFCKPKGPMKGTIFFLILLILPAALGPRVSSTSTRNEYQKQKNNVSRE